ncbi:MAG TPA: hypothetical protein VFL51_06395 [Pseudolabrys sp.]|nr:hypothetical protein [Pseudolabrys sp.]
MKLTIVAAAVAALAIFVPAAGSADAAGYSAGQGTALAEIDIARIKNALNLTPAQLAYWPAVEATLLDISHRQARTQSTDLVHRASRRFISIVLDGDAIQRLATAARPLVVALRDDQRRNARALAQEMGLGPVLAALH